MLVILKGNDQNDAEIFDKEFFVWKLTVNTKYKLNLHLK